MVHVKVTATILHLPKISVVMKAHYVHRIIWIRIKRYVKVKSVIVRSLNRICGFVQM